MKAHRQVEEAVRKAAKRCPKTWDAITAKRYILPSYRQEDYYSQQTLDSLMLFYLVSYCGHAFGRVPDPVVRCNFLLMAKALAEKRPVFYLEKELGEMLLRSKFPEDISTDDLHWRRRQLRIMLPKGLIALERGGEKYSIMYLDIGKVDQSDALASRQLSEELLNELIVAGRKQALAAGHEFYHDIVNPTLTKDGFVIGGQLDKYAGNKALEAVGGYPVGEHYGIIRPNGSLKVVLGEGSDFDPETGVECDANDDELMARMQHMAIQCLLFLGSVPLEYEVTHGDGLGGNGQHFSEHHMNRGLFPARFVGKSQYRPSAKTKHMHVANWTGRRLPQHWRCGHWKRQWFGPKRGQSTLIWIEPYETTDSSEKESRNKAA